MNTPATPLKRPILTLKKKVIVTPVEPVKTAYTPFKPVPKPKSVPKTKVVDHGNEKTYGALKARLEVHRKATYDLLKAKHPMRIICLEKMLLRLNKKLLEINGIAVSYSDTNELVISKIKDVDSSIPQSL